ncbi:MAG TPA: type 4a pilus biogenesis protein PilO [Gemmatimonadaceae bacterium]|jgi:type IV pilus assembly protein PilO|nr:type 4a pilus biogenesis protein PilO [Gemmatimonadaceae bacterium]
MAILPTNRNDQIKAFVVVLALAALGLYYNFLWAPKSEQLTTMQTHVDSLEALNQRARVEVAKGSLDKLKAQADEYAKEVDIMRQLVPTGNEVPALLEAVSTAARRAGLDISAVSPDGVVNSDQFDIYRYKLGVTGPYHQIGAFLTNIGELKRIVAPINVQLQPSTAQGRNQDPTKYLLDATLDIQTYVAHSSPAAAPAAPAAKGGK